MYRMSVAALILLAASSGRTAAQAVRPVLLKPARVFDGIAPGAA